MVAVGSGQILVAVVTLLAGSGFVFEAGRRIGRSAEQQENTDSDINHLESKFDGRFDQLDSRLDTLEKRIDKEGRERDREHAVVIRWIGNVTDALISEGYDVEKPDEVRQDIDVTAMAERHGDGLDDD